MAEMTCAKCGKSFPSSGDNQGQGPAVCPACKVRTSSDHTGEGEPIQVAEIIDDTEPTAESPQSQQPGGTPSQSTAGAAQKPPAYGSPLQKAEEVKGRLLRGFKSLLGTGAENPPAPSAPRSGPGHQDPAQSLKSGVAAVKGFFTQARQSVMQATASGDRCDVCSKELGLFARDYAPKLPESARQGKNHLCAECVKGFPVKCEACGAQWTLDPGAGIKSCPECDVRAERENWIGHEYDQFRKVQRWRMGLCHLGGGLLASQKHELFLVKTRSQAGDYFFVLANTMISGETEITHLNLSAVYLKSGDFVAECPVVRRTGYHHDAVWNDLLKTHVWTMYENVVCRTLPSQLVCLSESLNDIQVRLEAQGRPHVEFVVAMKDVRARLQFFVEKLEARQCAGQGANISDEDAAEAFAEGSSPDSSGKPSPVPPTDTAAQNQRPPASQGAPLVSRSEAPEASPEADTNQTLETLKKLKELLDAGILTNDEFAAKKAEILKRL